MPDNVIVKEAQILYLYKLTVIYLFKLQFDWTGMHGCYSITNLIANLKSIIFTSPFQLDKHAVNEIL